jgi:hypothetical protein
MTVRLEELLAAATPGPWHVDYGWEDYGGEDGGGNHGWVSPHGAYSTDRPTNELIALAPDAVRLLIDMGDELRRVQKHGADSMNGHFRRKALLARLDRLGNTT